MDVIELNGNLYDALTGAYVGKDSAAGAGTPAATAHHSPRHTGPAIHAAKPAVSTSARRDSGDSHTGQKHIPAHKPQRAHTLMRHVVKRPATEPAAPSVKAKAAPAITAVKPAVPVHTPKAAAISPNLQRTQRAQATGRSQLVSRFRSIDIMPAATPVTATPKPTFTAHTAGIAGAAAAKPQAAVPVTVPKRLNYHIKPPAKPDVFAADTAGIRPAQPARPAMHTALKPHHQAARPLDITAVKPVHTLRPVAAPVAASAKPLQVAQPAPVPARQQPHRPAASQPHYRHVQRPHPAAVQQASTRSASRPVQPDEQADADIFEHALAMARSHEQKPPKQSMLQSARQRKRARRIIGFAASAAVFVLLVGFIAYQNKAAIQLEMASAKAGFAATAPLYKPEGYSMNRISYEQGTVETTYSNGDKDAGINIVQKKSNWDSQTLLENFVSNKDGDYQGYQSGGRTVYVYGKRKVTWVNGGTWYQVDAAGTSMNDEQLVKLAASM